MERIYRNPIPPSTNAVRGRTGTRQPLCHVNDAPGKVVPLMKLSQCASVERGDGALL